MHTLNFFCQKLDTEDNLDNLDFFNNGKKDHIKNSKVVLATTVYI